MTKLFYFVILPIMCGLGILTVLMTYASWFDPNRIQEEKCYGSECPNPYLSNEIISADFEGKYVKVGLKNGTEIITDCITKQWNFSQNSTSWWCGNEIHTIQFVRNT